MTKIIHYIYNRNAGPLEEVCIESWKRIYPDFEFQLWEPGSSIVRILYDNGGLFLGSDVMAIKRIPDEYFAKSFVPWDDAFETTVVNPGICFYAAEPKEELFLQMFDGFGDALARAGINNRTKLGVSERDQELKDITIVNRLLFGANDKISFQLPLETPYLLHVNPEFNQKWEGFHVHTLVVDENSKHNNVYIACKRFCEMKPADGESHVLILVNNSPDTDFVNRMCTLLNYHINNRCNYNRRWLYLPIGCCDSVGDIITEYVGRKFNDVKSYVCIRT